jgi:hypothetical protein
MQKPLLIGGVSLVKGRVRDAGRAMVKISNDLEGTFESTSYVANAPFKTVSLILRFGLQTNLEPEYTRIDKRHNELHVAVELNMADLSTCNYEQLEELFMIATLKVLVDAGKKYHLPYEKFEEMLTEKLANRAGSAP